MHATVAWYEHCVIVGTYVNGRMVYTVSTRRNGETVHLGTAPSMVDARAIARRER